MVGLVLCAFFVLGVMTGFSQPGRAVTLRISNLFSSHTGVANGAAPANGFVARAGRALRALETRLGIRTETDSGRRGAAQGSAIAMVERRDGFYALSADGELNGPVSPNAEGDLPILSGARVGNARGAQLVEFAAMMVRAESELSHLVSEMNIDDDGTASLYLDRARTEVLVDIDDAPAEVRRAGEVLARWRGREGMVAAVDLTTPGQAVVRLAGVDAPVVGHGAAVRRFAERAAVSSKSGRPVAARRSP